MSPGLMFVVGLFLTVGAPFLMTMMIASAVERSGGRIAKQIEEEQDSYMRSGQKTALSIIGLYQILSYILPVIGFVMMVAAMVRGCSE